MEPTPDEATREAVCGCLITICQEMPLDWSTSSILTTLFLVEGIIRGKEEIKLIRLIIDSCPGLQEHVHQWMVEKHPDLFN